jgi:hypothetical protein
MVIRHDATPQRSVHLEMGYSPKLVEGAFSEPQAIGGTHLPV